MSQTILIAAVAATILAPAPIVTRDAPVEVSAPARPRAPVVHRIPSRPVRRRLAVVRYAGTGAWSLADAATIQEFFERRFGRPLPVSAWGQTLLHDRLRLDHHNALDVAVHPDSMEGRALMAFLRSEGFPFVAVRARMRGVSTGAHIHVGPESCRLPAARPAAVARAKAPRRTLTASAHGYDL